MKMNKRSPAQIRADKEYEEKRRGLTTSFSAKLTSDEVKLVDEAAALAGNKKLVLLTGAEMIIKENKTKKES